MDRFAQSAKVLRSCAVASVDSTDLAAAVGVIRGAVGGCLFWIVFAVIAAL